MLHAVFDEAVTDLLDAWRHHDTARRVGTTPLLTLARSRIRLEDARSRVHRFRVGLYPNEIESESVVLDVLCPELDDIVHIRSFDIQRIDATHICFNCPCGETVLRDR